MSAAEELPLDYDLWLIAVQRAYLLRLLRQAGGNQCKAALLAGVHRNTIQRLIQQTGITRKNLTLIRRQARNRNGDQFMSNASLALLDRDFSVANLQNNRSVIRELLKSVLVKGINNDYAAIPGTGRGDEEGKLTLLKPGAEKICSVFGIAVEPSVESIRDGEDVTFRVTCRMTSIASGIYLGSGIGEASTLESKYAWKAALCDEQFEAEDPHRRRLHWGKVWVTQAGKRVQVIDSVKQVRENPNDKMNTVLKMAKKRAMIDAVLTVTAASDTFTQDLETIVDNNAGKATAPVTGAQASAAMGSAAVKISADESKAFFKAWKRANRDVTLVKEYMKLHCGGITDDRQMETRYYAEALRWAGSNEPIPAVKAEAPRPAAAPAASSAAAPAGAKEPIEMIAIRDLFGYAGVDLAEQAALLQEYAEKLPELVDYLKARIDEQAEQG